MERIGYVLATAAVAVCVAIVAYNAQAFAAARTTALTADRTIQDLGTIQPGVYKGVFRLTNTSNRLIEISHATTSCGCLGVEVGDRSLDAGESTDVTSVWNVREDLVGDLSNTIAIVFAEAGAKQLGLLQLTMKGRVDPEWTTVPRSLNVRRQESTFFEVVLFPVAKDAEPPEALSAEIPHSSFEVEVMNQGRMVLVVYDAARPVVTSDALNLNVRMKSDSQKFVTVPVVIE